MDNEDPLPEDYETCSVCGYDHECDFPYLTPLQKANAMSDHDTALYAKRDIILS